MQLASAALWLGGCGAQPAEVGASREAIINGQDENGEAATLYLMNVGGVICTGSLISERVVLTAKHCVLDVPEDGWLAGLGPTGQDAQYEVEWVATTDGRDIDGIDIALMVLREIPAIEAYSLARDFGEYRIGDTLTLVGYGTTEDGTLGRKKRTDSDILALGPDAEYGLFENEFLLYGSGSSAGQGDSGGPVFDGDGVQVGVMVRSDLADVTAGIRVDRFLDLIDDTVGRAGDGQVGDDVSGRSLGSRCDLASECASGECEQGICTMSCSLIQGASCPRGSYCDARGSCGQGVCVVAQAGSRRIGNQCASDLECATLHCAQLQGGGPGHCALPCDPGSGACNDGSDCRETADGCGACVAGEGSQGGIGEGCATDSACDTGLCYAPGPAGVCTTSCSEDAEGCTAGFECRDELCAPQGGLLGDECTSRSDCSTGLCGRDADSGVGLCTRSCSDDEACGASYRCVQTQQGVGACWPSDSGDPSHGLEGGCVAAGPGVGSFAAAIFVLAVITGLGRRRG